MESQVAVGSSKRSRTQVYAGEANTLKSEFIYMYAYTYMYSAITCMSPDVLGVPSPFDS